MKFIADRAFAYPCEPIKGEGTVIPLINLSPENEKTLWRKQDMILMVVEFPAPFGPMYPTSSACWMWKETPRGCRQREPGAWLVRSGVMLQIYESRDCLWSIVSKSVSNGVQPEI